jgi:energy-coupling factor transport system ATP-binding protein
MNGIIPWRLKGFAKGEVNVFDKNIWDYEFSELSNIVGLVKQNPVEQLVTFTVRDEIAFGLENLKYPKEEIMKRVDEIAEFMGIGNVLDRDIDQLSGGQKQLAVLSSFLIMKPKILILDEPIAFLDQISESLLLDRLRKLKESSEYDLTLIIIEHRLSRVLNIADKIVVLGENGNIILEGSVEDVLKNKFESLKSCNVRVPWIMDVFYKFKKDNHAAGGFENPQNFPDLVQILDVLSEKDLLDLREVLIDTMIRPKEIEHLSKYEKIIDFNNLYVSTLKDITLAEQKQQEKIKTHESNGTILEVKNLNFEYPNSGIRAIKNLSIQIQQGDFIGLVGPNGSGKTTLLYLLANLYEPTSGEILFKGSNLDAVDQYQYAKNIGFIFQNPENMIFKPTIQEEVLYGPKNFGIESNISPEYLSKLYGLIGNEDPNKNPFKLSWGQKRRLNLSSIFVYDPDIILLDEPFIGQDQRTIDFLLETLFIENKRGKTIVISSHDYHLLLKFTKKIIELKKDGTLRNYDENTNYFSRHENLGPVILLEKINDKLRGGDP